MAETNPEIEAQLNALTEICCETLMSDRTLEEGRTDQLVKALLMSGFQQKKGPPLQSVLESRIRAACPEPAIHRGAEIKAVTDQIQAKYDKLVKWESQQPPSDQTPAKGANISSATGA